MKVTTVRFDDEVKNTISELAKQDKRSASYIINEAVKEYISLRKWRLQETEKSLEDYKNGNIVDHKEIQEILRSK